MTLGTILRGRALHGADQEDEEEQHVGGAHLRFHMTGKQVSWGSQRRSRRK